MDELSKTIGVPTRQTEVLKQLCALQQQISLATEKLQRVKDRLKFVSNTLEISKKEEKSDRLSSNVPLAERLQQCTDSVERLVEELDEIQENLEI